MVYTQHLICLLAVLSNPAGASSLRGARESNESASLEKAVDYDEVDFATDDLMMMEAMEATDDLMMFEGKEERNLDYRGYPHNHGGFRFGGVNNGVNIGPPRVGGNYGYGSLYGARNGVNYDGNFGPTPESGEETFNTGVNYGVGPYRGAYSFGNPYFNFGRGNNNANYRFNSYPYSNTYSDTYSYRYNYGNANANPYSYNSIGAYNSFNDNYYSQSYGYGYAPNFYGYNYDQPAFLGNNYASSFFV